MLAIYVGDKRRAVSTTIRKSEFGHGRIVAERCHIGPWFPTGSLAGTAASPTCGRETAEAVPPPCPSTRPRDPHYVRAATDGLPSRSKLERPICPTSGRSRYAPKTCSRSSGHPTSAAERDVLGHCAF
jgi:hypothetical protein